MLTGNPRMDAQKAFDRARGASRRHTLITRLRRGCLECVRLSVHDTHHRRPNFATTIQEIPVEQITATVEPSRAGQFDALFRPNAKRTRGRWERLWIAEQQGETLPPIDVIRTACGYAVVDGHHRVSVARARGALTIDAVVTAS